MIDKDLFIENTKAMLENDNCGLVSDGDHSFNDLYHHRAILTASLFNCNKDICWKSKLHDTDDMFDGYFIVGMDTKQGSATYHYPLEYWNLFDVKELPNAPKWDGHTAEQAIERIKNHFYPSIKGGANG